MAITEVFGGDPTLRATYYQSFYISTIPGIVNLNATSPLPGPFATNVPTTTNVAYLCGSDQAQS
jgi:hypothetical protein